MKLSRSHALLLVGTIAAAGCVVENSDDDAAKGGEGGDGATGGTAGSGTAGKGVAGSGKAGSSSSAGKGGSGSAGKSSGGTAGSGTGIAGSSSVAEGGATSGGEGGQSQAGQTSNGGAGGEGGTATCNDGDAAQLSCDALDTSSCDIKAFLDSECAMTWTTMKPSISNVARNCMLGLSQDELCNDATNVYHCVDQALKDACPDETVKDSCDQIVANCPTAADSCSTYLSGLKQAGRDEMVSCMESWCDFYICAESLN